jgi:oligosaccharide repeat unit polymerase
MVLTLSFQVTYVTYPTMGLPVLLFVLSLASFLFGYLASRTLLHRWPTNLGPLRYTIDMTQLWQSNLLFCGAAILIIVFNWALSGPPPALGDPTSYLTYGRFKQVLFPLLVVVTVNSTLDASRWRKALFCVFGIAGMALYITRGLLMVALLQMLFVYSLKTRMSKKKLYSIAVGCLAVAVVAITLIGNARTAQGVFLEYLQIRHRFSDWPMAYLWLTSYISIPFSNLCWFFAKGNFHGPTLSFLYPLLPSFLMPPDPHASIHHDLRIIDGASTYLAAYALDFSYLGVFLANLALGMGCGWLMERSLPKNILVAGIFLTCLTFIFFSDMFTPLSTILQFAIQAAVQKRCFQWGAAPAESMVTQ